MEPPAPSALWRDLPTALGAGGRVDRVELKVLLDASLEEALALLGTRVRPPLLRSVHYLDTPDFALIRRGIIARVRSTRILDGRRRRSDVVVKLCRPARPAKDLFVELDALPTAVRRSATSLRRFSEGECRAASLHKRPVRQLLSTAQADLLRSAASDLITDLDELEAFGPITGVRVTSHDLKERIAVESWSYPGDLRIVELSAKCRPARSGPVVRTLRKLISDREIMPSREQMTKTQIASRQLGAFPFAA